MSSKWAKIQDISIEIKREKMPTKTGRKNMIEFDEF